MELFRQPLILLWTALGMGGLLLLAYLGARRRESLLARLGDAGLLGRLVPPETAARRRIKTALWLSAAFLAFIAWAGPQWGVELLPGEAATNHVVIALDTSLSMLAPDIKPNRIANAKNMLSLLIDQLDNYRVGIEAFSGKAFVQCPITTDQQALKYFVSTAEAGMLPDPGTALGDAIYVGVNMLAKYPGKKVLILLTDGEDHNSDVKGAVQAAADASVAIFSVGIGKPEGELIPVKAQDGSASAEYKKDKEGKTVVSKLDEKTLLDAASATGGVYIRYTEPEAVATEIISQLGNFEKVKWKSRARAGYKNRYQLPLLLALLALLLELLIPEQAVSPGRKLPMINGKKILTIAALALLAGTSADAKTVNGFLRSGNKEFKAERYEQAFEQYSGALKKSPKDARAFYNAGSALYKMDEYEKAQQSYDAASKNEKLSAASRFNAGNAFFRQGKFKEAAQSYIKTLEMNPGDNEAKYNLQLALQLQKQNKPPCQKPDKKDDKNQKDKPDSKDKKNENKDKPSGSGISKEDAERIMQLAKEKEQAATPLDAKRFQQPRQSRNDEDW